MHNFESVGKHGFTRPPETRPTVAEVDLQRLDEDIHLLVEDGLAEETEDGYRIDAATVADPSADVDIVKVLGDPNLRHTLTVEADAFSDSAAARIEAAGGEAVRTEQAADDAAE